MTITDATATATATPAIDATDDVVSIPLANIGCINDSERFVTESG
eukprot:CAMPEP_0119550466 /NCGR_PEP_ID=MMETSP1352-20130426/3972_1 /TAXON_ID=265584 /ORGANISM="Stauroneis constricta, Strain CCMP1120" /LENGTH=44 /DNA_ID= /DNA_START= /DNA_END= /DNA_ORIENTATION=